MGKVGARVRKNQRQINLLLVNLAYIMEGADVALLPAVYREIGKEMLISPTGLGSLTLARKLVEILCYPFSAVLATTYNRSTVIALGVTLWAISTAGVGSSQSFYQVAFTRAVSGVGVALVAPAVRSMVADSTGSHHRGLTFGLLHVMGTLGHWLGGVFAILLGETSVSGIQGWRVVFFSVAFLSEVIALLVHFFVVDSRNTELATNLSICVSPSTNYSLASKMSTESESRPFRSQVALFLVEARKVMTIPSFQVIVGQGIPGSFPLTAAAFFPMWLELIRFSHQQTASLQTVFLAARAFGSILIGLLSDYVALLLPNAGRIAMAQFSSLSAIFISAVLLLGLQPDASNIWPYAVTLFMLGFLTSSVNSATISPMYAEIVHEDCRTTIYALDHFFEALLSSFATPIVGLLAERIFGYVRASKGATVGPQTENDIHNAYALAKALYVSFGVPSALCALMLTLLYSTYPRDRDRVRWEASQIELQVELAQSDAEESSGSGEQVYKQVMADDVEEENDEDSSVADCALETTHMISQRQSVDWRSHVMVRTQ